ncbi:GntR family transcriptional regulator [Bradyrhizobium ivorense]|uniref:GntR family transcriptional regulator n=1 Tax=Bradyrhizobium ivorense TaxID=2511166 RepID=UPI0010BBB5E9|nr:GntR family transcriptional regulator [Bradyrhizobium ivorense]VIO69872.1 hypothetical protein CI41S_21190 [Bradyrhizobium ivorense]
MNLLPLCVEKEDKSSSTLDTLFDFVGISGSLRPSASAGPYERMNTLTERADARLRYALIVGQCAPGKCLAIGTLVQGLGTSIAPVRDALSQFVSADAPNATGRSGMVVPALKRAKFGELLKRRRALEGFPFSSATALHRMSDCRGFMILHAVWAVQLAILKRGQPSSPVMHVGRFWRHVGPTFAFTLASMDRWCCTMSHLESIVAVTGYTNLVQARSCVPDEISARMARVPNTVAGERVSVPRSRRLLGSHSKKLRPMEMAIPSRWKGKPEGSNRGSFSRLAKWIKQRQRRYFLVRRRLLYPSGAVGSPVTAFATV